MMMFSDKEHRILLSAISREKEICKRVDKESCREPYEESLENVCKRIEKKIYDLQHKYAWHDLRKNPEDLPTKDCRYLITKSKYGFYSITSYADGFNCNRKLTGEVIRDYEIKGDIAWKEIEPFESEDDDV